MTSREFTTWQLSTPRFGSPVLGPRSSKWKPFSKTWQKTLNFAKS